MADAISETLQKENFNCKICSDGENGEETASITASGTVTANRSNQRENIGGGRGTKNR